MLQLIKVRGNSIAPYLQDGDFAIILKSRWVHKSLKCGDYIVFHQSQFGTLIKQVHQIQPDGSLLVRGSDDFSTDSRLFGAVAPDQVAGKVIWCIRQ